MLSFKVIYHRSDVEKVLETQIYVDVCTVAVKRNAHQDEVDSTLWPTSTVCVTALRFLTGYSSLLVRTFKA